MSYPSYPEHVDSEAEWLGAVPSHWSVKRLKYCLTPVRDKTTFLHRPIALEHIESWSGALVEAEVDYEGDGIAFEPGDILFGKLRPYLAKVYRAKASGQAVGDFHVMRPAAEIDPDYAEKQILQEGFISVADGATYGAKMPRVGWEFMANMLFAVPPQNEQTQIARFLDHQTARIDALITEQQRLIELLKEKRQAAISHAVTKGLDPDVAMKDSGVEWLGEVPAHWDVTRVKWVAKLESGHTPSKSIPEYWEDCDIPWVSLNDSKTLANNDYIENTVTEINALGMANSAAHILPRGTVVFTRDATIGLTAVTTRPMAVSQHLIAWVCREQILPEFLLFIFYAMEEELQRSTAGATIKTIGMPEVRKMVTTVPSVDEQESIVEHIFKRKQQLEETEAEAESFIKLLKERRSALISAAVTGKIDVRDWEPPVSETFPQSSASEKAPA